MASTAVADWPGSINVATGERIGSAIIGAALVLPALARPSPAGSPWRSAAQRCFSAASPVSACCIGSSAETECHQRTRDRGARTMRIDNHAIIQKVAGVKPASSLAIRMYCSW